MTARTEQPTAAGDVLDRTRIYAGGGWVPSGGTGAIDVVNAATEVFATRCREGVRRRHEPAMSKRRRAAGHSVVC